MTKLLRIFLPTIVGISVYIIVSKLFPNKVLDQNSQKDLRGGEIIKTSLINKIIDQIKNNRALTIALFSIFITAGVQSFQQEIEKLLVDEVFNELCVEKVDGQLKIVCDIIKEHELNLHTKSIKELIATNSISIEDKIHLLKIKLDFIINSEFRGKKKFLIVSVLAIIYTICISGVGGLAIFLSALNELFQEGKLSRALYEQILEMVKKKCTNDHLN